MTTITEKDVERFTCGDCWILAKAINELTGWPIYAFKNQDGEPDDHVFVMPDPDHVLDAEGHHDLKTFARRWCYKPDELYAHKRSELAREWGPVAFGTYSYKRARLIAPVLVDTVCG